MLVNAMNLINANATWTDITGIRTAIWLLFASSRSRSLHVGVQGGSEKIETLFRYPLSVYDCYLKPFHNTEKVSSMKLLAMKLSVYLCMA
jgi:hypothetical protein